MQSGKGDGVCRSQALLEEKEVQVISASINYVVVKAVTRSNEVHLRVTAISKQMSSF